MKANLLQGDIMNAKKCWILVILILLSAPLLLVDLCVYGSLALVIFLICIVCSLISKSKAKNNDGQSKNGIEKDEEQQDM